MDNFLFFGDFVKAIQADNLQQIINNNLMILDAAKRAAVEECTSYLRQKYDISKNFQPTPRHDLTQAYKAMQTVYVNEPDYNTTSLYAIGDRVAQSGKIYRCKTAITVPELFNQSKWDYITQQYSLYYAIPPAPEFNYQRIYAIGDVVFWNNATYTARLTSQVLDHEAMLQIGRAGTEQVVNIFPDDPVKGRQYWGDPAAYEVPKDEGIEVTDTDYWVEGDSRDQKLLMICVDIALYHLHARIAPRNIPDLRTYRYMGQAEDRISAAGRIIYPTYSALGWLQAAATGDITPEMPVLQPAQGRRVRFGGNIKHINAY